MLLYSLYLHTEYTTKNEKENILSNTATSFNEVTDQHQEVAALSSLPQPGVLPTLVTESPPRSHAWSITNEVTTMVAGKFTYTKVKHNTRQKALFPFLVVVSLCTILRTTSIVAILQV